MKTSICIATRDHAALLDRTLASIFAQKPPFDFEVIIIDDGANDDTPATIAKYPRVISRLLDRLPAYSPVRARNLALRMASGEVIIQQSDEVIHVRQDTIERLALDLRPGTFLIGTVHNYSVETGTIGPRYTPTWTDEEEPRPLFFLGSHWRNDAYRIGGYDPDFQEVIGSEDFWFADCLIHGLNLTPVYSPVLGLHQEHPRPEHDYCPGMMLRDEKIARGVFLSTGGPW